MVASNSPISYSASLVTRWWHAVLSTCVNWLTAAWSHYGSLVTGTTMLLVAVVALALGVWVFLASR